MFEAVKLLKGQSKTSNVVVHDGKNNVITNIEEKVNVIKVWFENHYTGDEPALEPFEGEPRPLNTVITAEEVKICAKRLKNNKAILFLMNC